MISSFVISANAEEFDFEFIDSKTYIISYDLINATLLDIIKNPQEDFSFYVNGTNGELYVSLPKSVPRDIADEFPAFVLLNGFEFDEYGESDCFYEFAFHIDGYSKVEFIFGYPLAGPRLVYEDLPSKCISKTIPTPLKQFRAGIPIEEIQCKEGLSLVIKSTNGNPACVKPRSVEKLIQRGWTNEIFLLETKQKLSSHKDCMNTDSTLAYEGITHQVPFLVRVAWNPYDLKTNSTVNFEIQIFDENSKPLQDVTYDFVWKTGPDSGVIDDRYVADFGKIDFDVLPIKTADPCYITVLVHIDEIGKKSFKRTDPLEIEKYGNMSPVAIQFHHYAID